jgi:branched-chain amino acid aminotransferase
MGKKNEGGELTLKVKNWLKDIMYGREHHPWAHVVPEEQ